MIISCNANQPADKEPVKLSRIQEGPAAPTPVVTPLTSEERASVIAGFREFRDAVYHRNKEKVKTFIDFPITAEHNEVWYLAQGYIDQTADDMSRPFTEKDFDKYFNKVFNTKFINALLNIKADSLFSEQGVHSPYYEQGDTLQYRMDVRYYENNQSLSMAVNENTYHENSENNTELSIIYEFAVVQGKLKWRGVVMAG